MATKGIGPQGLGNKNNNGFWIGDGSTKGINSPAKDKDPREVKKDVIPSSKPRLDKQLTNKQIEQRRVQNIIDKQGTITSSTPQSTLSKVTEVALNPLTAAGYAARNERLPENFSRGKRNPFDSAIDVINPAFYAKEGAEAVKNTGSSIENIAKGKLPAAYRDIKNVGMNVVNALPLVSEVIPAIKAAKALKAGRAIALEEQEASKAYDAFEVKANKINSLADKKIAKYSDIHKEKFENTFGKKYTEKDLGLHGRLQETEMGKRDPKVASIIKINNEENKLKDPLEKNSLTSVQNKDKEFERKHGISKRYSKTDELLNNAYTHGYDSRMSNRREIYEDVDNGDYDAVNPNKKFYKKEVAPKLENLIKKNKLKSEENLFRGEGDYGLSHVWRDNKKLPKGSVKLSELQVGDIHKPGSFISTSRDINRARGFGEVISHIKAPKGQSILNSNSLKGGAFPSEKEVVLPSKLRFKVESIHKAGNNTIFKKSIVNPYTIAGGLGLSSMFHGNKK